MKIKINDISQEGLNLEETQAAAALDLEREDLKFVSPIHISAFVTKDKDDVYAHIAIKGRIEVTCACCLSVSGSDFSKEFDLSYDAKGKRIIDFTDDIRQEIIVDYPIKPLCQADCKGLCQVCGKNLNEGDCKHKTDAQRWKELEKGNI